MRSTFQHTRESKLRILSFADCVKRSSSSFDLRASFQGMFYYHKVIDLIPSNLNKFHLSSHLALATENSIQASLPKITEWYPLSRSLSYHLAIRKSCVRGGNVVAEGGQKRCGTRLLESTNKKKRKDRCTFSCSARTNRRK